MVNQLGNYSLYIALLISIFIIIKTSLSFRNSSNVLSGNIFSLISVQSLMVIISFLTLIYAFVTSDFSNETVYNNSHTTKPLFYKISGTWGNHEGSLLLWLLVLTIFLFLFVIDSKNLPQRYRTFTLFFQEIIIFGFLLFILFTSNPFANIFPIPSEGTGLNPILQDPALAIHPPILYLGYVGTSIIFSSALGAIISGSINKSWASHIKRWVLISWVFLSIGILLGSIWAYYELGWGGFWFWDPVENVSLMPWLCLTALLHTVFTLEKTFLVSKETAVLINNLFMMFFLSVVLIGTVYPIFLEVINDEKISIGPPFYRKLIIPFLIPFLFFMAIGPNIKWVKDKMRKINLKDIFIFIISMVISYIFVNKFGVSYLLSLPLFIFSLFLFFVTIKDFFGKNINISQKISHFGFSLLILSILLNGVLAKEHSSNMRVGDEIKFLDKMIQFQNIEVIKKQNYQTLIGKFNIVDENNSLSLKPEIRIYDQPQTITSEADISSTIFADNFLVFNIIKDDGFYNVRYQIKPFMIWIWISVLLISLGGILSLKKKNV